MAKCIKSFAKEKLQMKKAIGHFSVEGVIKCIMSFCEKVKSKKAIRSSGILRVGEKKHYGILEKEAPMECRMR